MTSCPWRFGPIGKLARHCPHRKTDGYHIVRDEGNRDSGLPLKLLSIRRKWLVAPFPDGSGRGGGKQAVPGDYFDLAYRSVVTNHCLQGDFAPRVAVRTNRIYKLSRRT